MKNKAAPPFAEAEFDIVFGRGINHEADIVEKAVSDGIVEKKGAWFQYRGQLIGQGRDATAQALAENQQLSKTLEDAILSKHAIIPVIASIARVEGPAEESSEAPVAQAA